MDYILENMKIAVVGLGYVGMPLAVALAKYNSVTGYDINEKRVQELNDGWDSNREIRQNTLKTTSCEFTSDISNIKDAQIYIVTVPTPINNKNEPDLSIIEQATYALGKIIDKNDIIIYESTVYPSVTEDICGSILEKTSGLISGKDFILGYSPERINPGDEEHTVENITKVVAAQTPEAANLLSDLYGQMNGNNIFIAKNIKTAEASKAIENAQRDINIAFINEVTMLLNKMGISAHDVIDAAKTKWNFLPFTPGLVGGHCIGVDPYYLAKSAIDVGHKPDVILAGRKINDSMGAYIASHINELLKPNDEEQDILILGFTFKENINDIRNTKVIDIIKTLESYGYNIDIHDPHALPDEVEEEYGISILTSLPKNKKYNCITLAVNHKIYSEMGITNIASLLKTDQKSKAVIYDIKATWKYLSFPDKILYKTM